MAGSSKILCHVPWFGGVSFVVHDEIWRGTWIIEQPRNFQFREKVELSFDRPLGARSTELSADKPIFWELEVKLDLPGLDFSETYLVPVYGRADTSVASKAERKALSV